MWQGKCGKGCGNADTARDGEGGMAREARGG